MYREIGMGERRASHMLPYVEHFLVDSLRARSTESLRLVSVKELLISLPVKPVEATTMTVAKCKLKSSFGQFM